jgi:peptidoglycan/LPS O-acetylase OafA/YrhL
VRFGLWLETFSQATVHKIDGSMWSLVVELHFYILLPLLSYCLARLSHGSLARAGGLLLILGSVGAALRIVLPHLDSNSTEVYRNWLPTTFQFFVPGMLLALLRVAWQQGRLPPLRGPLARGDVWLLGSLPFWAAVFWHFSWEPLCIVASFLAVGACVLPVRPGRLVGVLERRPLAALGVASYSLYLWHLPLEVHLHRASWEPGGFLGQLGVALAASCAVAAVSYLVIEAPFLRLRRRWTPDIAAPQRPVDPAHDPRLARVATEP